MSKAGHVAAVDALRFFAAIIVMIFHLGYWIWAFPTGMGGRAAHASFSFPEFQWISAYGWIGVEIFFVISGFVIAFSAEKSTARQFLASRVARLAPSVWLVGSLTLLIALFTFQEGHLELIKSWVRSMIFVPFGSWIDPNYWTLGVEIAFYCLVWLLLLRNGYRHLDKLSLTLGLISGVYWLCWWSPFGAPLREAASSRWLELLLVYHGIYFALGIQLQLYRSKGMTGSRVLFVLWLVAAAVLEIMSASAVISTKTATVQSAVVPILLWLVCMAFMVWSLRANWVPSKALGKWLKVMGLMTYPLYLVHHVAGAALMGMLIRLAVPASVALVAAILASLLASYLVAVVLEPPMQRWLRGAVLMPRAVFRRAPQA